MSTPPGGRCWYCSAELTHIDYGRQDSCPKCGRDTRVCKNCGFFDPAVHNQCHETQADRVVDKERSNFCDYFKPGSGLGGSGPTKDALKSAADALFKKK